MFCHRKEKVDHFYHEVSFLQFRFHIICYNSCHFVTYVQEFSFSSKGKSDCMIEPIHLSRTVRPRREIPWLISVKERRFTRLIRLTVLFRDTWLVSRNTCGLLAGEGKVKRERFTLLKRMSFWIQLHMALQ